MKTVDEMKKMPCPLQAASGGNCWADGCPMWRVVMGVYSKSKGDFVMQGEEPPPISDIERRPTKYGYCGLAGRLC